MRDSSVLLSHDTEFLYSTYAAESQFARRNCTDIAVGYKQKQGQTKQRGWPKSFDRKEF